MNIKCYTLILLTLVCLHQVSWAVSSKAGVGEVYSNVDCVNQLGVNWYYTWTQKPKPGETSAQFIPMIWNNTLATDEILDSLKQNNPSGILLGFNEPERKDQANMSVQLALQLWPKLEKTGFRLGSPAISLDQNGKNWLHEFMTQADQQGLKVDFVCAHWYGDITKPDAVDQLRSEMEELHNNYNRPVWLTEFGVMDMYFKNGEDRNEIALNFMKGAIPMLESLPYLERYAWFTTKSYPQYLASTLFKSPPTDLTPLGEAYKSLISN